MTTPYCGSKPRPPRGRAFGTPGNCYRTGLKSGFAAASQKAEAEAGKAREMSKTKEKISGVLGQKKIIEKINTSGMAGLKGWLHVGNPDLKADEIRSIVARLHRAGTLYPGPGSHTNASKAAMVDWLIQLGWQR